MSAFQVTPNEMVALPAQPAEVTEAEVRPGTPSGPADAAELVIEDLLIEDVSIDGMCGVY